MKTVYLIIVTALGWVIAIIQTIYILRRLNQAERKGKDTIDKAAKDVAVNVDGNYLMVEKVTTRKEIMLYCTEANGMYAERALLRSVAATNGINLKTAHVSDEDIITLVNVHDVYKQNIVISEVTQSNIMEKSDIVLFNHILRKDTDANFWLYEKYGLIPMDEALEKEPNTNISLN